MPLNTNGPDFDLTGPEDYNLGVTTMILGRNVVDDEFRRRLYAWERLLGPLRQFVTDDGVEARAWTEDEIKPLYGYATNASNMTDTQFRNHLWKQFKESVVF